MGSDLQILIPNEDECYAQKAAYAAFELIDELESELSPFVDSSDIARINRLQPKKTVRIGSVRICRVRIGRAAFECLKFAKLMYSDTKGAFDISYCSGELEEVFLNAESFSAELLTKKVELDPGGIGKGYAADRAAQLLSEWDIEAGLVTIGASSIRAFGSLPEGRKWPCMLSSLGNPNRRHAKLFLEKGGVGGSGTGKGLHIIDPRTGRRPSSLSSAWSLAPTATEADALSTAAVILRPREIEEYCGTHPGTAVLLAGGDRSRKRQRVTVYGDWKGNLSVLDPE